MTTPLQLAQIILGMAFFLYLPGYFVTELAFPERRWWEKALLAVVFSIMIGMAIGIFFGYDRAQAARTGGFTLENLWLGEIVITLLLATGLYVKRILKKEKKK